MGTWRLKDGAGHPCQSEIEHLDLRRALLRNATAQQHDIGRLQIAMDDAGVVGGSQRVRELHGDAERLANRQRPSRRRGPTTRPGYPTLAADARSAHATPGCETVGESLAVQILHDEVRDAGVLPDVVDRADVRVRQRRDGSGLAIESLVLLRVAGVIGPDDFDRHHAIEAGIAGLVDLAHAPGAEGRLDEIRTKTGAGSERHRPGAILIHHFGVSGGRRRRSLVDEVEQDHDRVLPRRR